MNKKQIEQWARDSGILPHFARDSVELLERFAALVSAHEREQCALVCEQVEDSAWGLWKIDYDPNEQGRSIGAGHCANAIRERNNQQSK